MVCDHMFPKYFSKTYDAPKEILEKLALITSLGSDIHHTWLQNNDVFLRKDPTWSIFPILTWLIVANDSGINMN